jgi:hypothetical protein
LVMLTTLNLQQRCDTPPAGTLPSDTSKPTPTLRPTVLSPPVLYRCHPTWFSHLTWVLMIILNSYEARAMVGGSVGD